MVVDTRARKRRRSLDAQAGVVIPGLPFEVVVTHVLREENLPDPADLAVLRGSVVGCATPWMRCDDELRRSMKMTLLNLDT